MEDLDYDSEEVKKLSSKVKTIKNVKSTKIMNGNQKRQ